MIWSSGLGETGPRVHVAASLRDAECKSRSDLPTWRDLPTWGKAVEARWNERHTVRRLHAPLPTTDTSEKAENVFAIGRRVVPPRSNRAGQINGTCPV